MIETRPIFSMTLTVPSIVDLGATPLGHRKIAQVTGGTFVGDRLRGTVHAGLAVAAQRWRADAGCALDAGNR